MLYEPSCLFPVFNSYFLQLTRNFPSYLENHHHQKQTAADRCYSHILTCSHTYCTPWHTQAHSLPKTMGHVKGMPGQISLSSDISTPLLAVCLTFLPFWENLGSCGKHLVMSPFKEGLYVSVDVRGCGFTSFRRIFLHHWWRLFCIICPLWCPLIAGQTLVKIKLLRSPGIRFNFERALAIGIFLLLWSTSLHAQ